MKKEHVTIFISELKSHPKNPKGHDDKLIKQSISELGFVDDIVIDEDNMILAGHGRVKAMQSLGKEKIDCIKITGWTEEQKDKFLILSNKSVEVGGWNDDILKEFGKDLLASAGFISEELDKIFPAEADEKDDEVPEVPEEAKSKLGEIYQLGRHRIMCGDSTRIKDVEKLMDGKKADMVFTDPPYGIKIVGKNGTIGKEKLAKAGVYSEVIGDETTDCAKEFYKTCIELGFTKQIIWGGNYFVDFLPFSNSWIIWDKRGDMASNKFADGEMAWCSFHTRVRIYKQIWAGMIREGEKDKRLHPTQKPIMTLEKILNDFTNINDNIYDGFLGSGSTLIACEKTDRICYGMELDPKYIDVIIQRWEEFTGEKAILLDQSEPISA